MNRVEFNNIKTYVKNEKNRNNNEIDLNDFINILKKKINNHQIIDSIFTEKIVNEIKLYCDNHNNIINDWYDEKYKKNLFELLDKNKEYKNSADIYYQNSFIKINKLEN